MHGKTGSGGLRMAAVLLLVLGVLPMSFAFYAERTHSEGTPEDATVSPAQTDATWVASNEIDVQLKPGADDASLADLGKRIGAPFAWNSPTSREETDVADAALPAGAYIEADLAALRADSRVEAADVTHIYREPAGEMQSSELPAQVEKTADDNDGSAWK